MDPKKREKARADDICQLCGQTRWWHSLHTPRHAFQEPGAKEVVLEEVEEGSNESPERPPDEASSMGGQPPIQRMPPADLVLRAVLIRAGIITNEQLAQIELALQIGGEVIVSQGVSSGPDHTSESRADSPSPAGVAGSADNGRGS